MDLATFFAVVIVGFIASFSFGVTSFGLTLVFVIGCGYSRRMAGLMYYRSGTLRPKKQA